MTNIDTELVKRINLGDKDAFDELYSRNYKLIYSVVFKLCKNHADTQDLVQETFFKLFKYSKKFVDRGKGDKVFKNWLATLAHHTTVTSFTRRYNTRFAPLKIDIKDRQPSPLDALIEKEKKEINLKRISKIMSVFDPVLYGTCMLYAYGDKSFIKAGKIMGKSKSAISMRLSEARKHLLKNVSVFDVEKNCE